MDKNDFFINLTFYTPNSTMPPSTKKIRAELREKREILAEENRETIKNTNVSLENIRRLFARLYPYSDYNTALQTIKSLLGTSVQVNWERSKSLVKINNGSEHTFKKCLNNILTVKIQCTIPIEHQGTCLKGICVRCFPSLCIVCVVPHQIGNFSCDSDYVGLPISTTTTSGSIKKLRHQFLNVLQSIEAELEAELDKLIEHVNMQDFLDMLSAHQSNKNIWTRKFEGMKTHYNYHGQIASDISALCKYHGKFDKFCLDIENYLRLWLKRDGHLQVRYDIEFTQMELDFYRETHDMSTIEFSILITIRDGNCAVHVRYSISSKRVTMLNIVLSWILSVLRSYWW